MAKTKKPATETIEILEAEIIEIPQELAIIKQEHGLKLADDKLDAHVLTYAPYFKELVDLEPEMSALLTKEITPDTMKEATALRKKYLKIRTATNKQKLADKEGITAEGKFLDAVYNRVKDAAEGKESACEEIEKKLEKIENDRIAELRATRIGILEALDYDTEFLTVEEMSDESFSRLVAKATAAKQALELSEQQREEAKRKASELAEQKAERINKLAALGLTFNPTPDGGFYTGLDANIPASDLTLEAAEFDYMIKAIEASRDVRLKTEADALQAQKEAAAKLTARINQVTGLGFKWDDEKQAYENDDYSIGLEYLKAEADETYNTTLATIEAVIAEQKKAAEQYERREKYLLDLGFEYDEDADIYERGSRTITADDVENLGVAEFSAIYSDAKKQVEAEKKEAADKKKADDEKLVEAEKIKAAETARLKKIEDEKAEQAEALRASALAPDKMKMQAFYKTFSALEFPEMATTEGKAAIELVKELHVKMKAFIVVQGKKLA